MKKIYFLVLALGLFMNVNAQIVNVPDANFKTWLLLASPINSIARDLNGNHIKIDANNNSEIEVSEALAVYGLDISSFGSVNDNISDLTGIEYFINLRGINCGGNSLSNLNLTNLIHLESLDFRDNQLTYFDATPFTELQYLYISGNQLSVLIVNGLSNLKYLSCYDNQLTSLNLDNLPVLDGLGCNNNQLTSLNLSNLSLLQSLECAGNQLSSLDISNLHNLYSINCSDNFISTLDLTGLHPNFGSCWCNNNLLTTLDISNYPRLSRLSCAGNQLTNLFIKNGNRENDYLNFSNNPDLQYICADDDQLSSVQSLINSYGFANCFVNSYCTFSPGGTYYTIQGNNRYDSNSNGCDVLDLPASNLKFAITNAGITGNLISNISGNYSLPVNTGITTIAPILENPTYFNISPTTVNVNFPTQASPFTQNFCLTANGTHPDLEVTLLPLNSARPGFDVKYKIVYKNKGTTTQSGTINLTFNDAVLDLVSVNPVVSSQTTNTLSWNFTNLLPFISKEIIVTLNLNSPVETPSVNSGYLLSYTASISSSATDHTPNDNSIILNQTVTNSFDPNDKTCLEGATIAPVKVGDYVNYMIRFENNGTANAQNIVVKDMIDTAKFNINTLVPISGSHEFKTRITETNKVEFIFENINLPFDDSNNDGYVAFKIKTKPTLVLGNTFSNTASIYFDYNFPIVTNTATTTIAALSRQDFEFADYFNVYPNPVKDILNISATAAIEVSSITIYNTLGQLVLVIPNAKNIKAVDVSNLTSGNYFIKIHSDKGVSNTKFIKN